MVQTVLDQFFMKVPGCETLAFVDLKTLMVLLTNSDSSEGQETLNAMCKEAKTVLQNGNIGIICTDEQFHLFLRSEHEPTDALCCICNLSVDLNEFLPAAQSCLETISSSDATNE
jgi:hypothetical protein